MLATVEQWLPQTKLRPPLLRDDLFLRPRLAEVLRHSLTTFPLTLLSAPAGYGKTSLLAALPQLFPELPLAWLTLDQDDNDPTRFLAGLIASLRRPSIRPRPSPGSIVDRLTGCMASARSLSRLACLRRKNLPNGSVRTLVVIREWTWGLSCRVGVGQG